MECVALRHCRTDVAESWRTTFTSIVRHINVGATSATASQVPAVDGQRVAVIVAFTKNTTPWSAHSPFRPQLSHLCAWASELWQKQVSLLLTFHLDRIHPNKNSPHSMTLNAFTALPFHRVFHHPKGEVPSHISSPSPSALLDISTP